MYGVIELSERPDELLKLVDIAYDKLKEAAKIINEAIDKVFFMALKRQIPEDISVELKEPLADVLLKMDIRPIDTFRYYLDAKNSLRLSYLIDTITQVVMMNKIFDAARRELYNIVENYRYRGIDISQYEDLINQLVEALREAEKLSQEALKILKVEIPNYIETKISCSCRID